MTNDDTIHYLNETGLPAGFLDKAQCGVGAGLPGMACKCPAYQAATQPDEEPATDPMDADGSH